MASPTSPETTPVIVDAVRTPIGRFRGVLKDVRAEMRKVISPSRAEVQSTTIVVLVTVFIFAAYFWLVDNIIGRAIEALLHRLTQHH